MPKPPDQLDSRIEIVTPENIAFQYRLAGPFRRAPAFLIDCLVQIAIFYACVFVLYATGRIAGLGGMGTGLVFLVVFGLAWFYGGVLETFWNGQTIGKWSLGIRVVSTSGLPIDAKQAVMRNLLRVVETPPPLLMVMALLFGQAIDVAFFIAVYQVGLWAPAFNSRYQRLGDLASGTMVVFEESPRAYGVVRVTEPEALRLADWIPLDYVVSRSLARTLSMYVDRRGGFAWSRRIEIARHLAEPLRRMFQLPPQTNPDLLLCALYHRAFFAALPGEEKRTRAANSWEMRVEPTTVPVAMPIGATPNLQRVVELDHYLDRIV